MTHQTHHHGDAPDAPVCPVCEMNVDPQTAPQREYQGQTYYFCDADCRDEFEAAPERYTAPRAD